MSDLINDANEVEIKNGRLIKYNGCGAEVIIPCGVSCIEEDAFSHRYNIVSVTIPDSVINICDGAFCYCEGLTDLKIGNNVKCIGAEAFRGCGLKSVIIPDSVPYLGQSSFYACNSLISITLPRRFEAVINALFDKETIKRAKITFTE